MSDEQYDEVRRDWDEAYSRGEIRYQAAQTALDAIREAHIKLADPADLERLWPALRTALGAWAPDISSRWIIEEYAFLLRSSPCAGSESCCWCSGDWERFTRSPLWDAL